jgi:hypothetical protein
MLCSLTGSIVGSPMPLIVQTKTKTRYRSSGPALSEIAGPVVTTGRSMEFTPVTISDLIAAGAELSIKPERLETQ